jgi:hypothetical protein
MLEKIPPLRALIYLLVLALIPIVFSTFFVYSSYQNLSAIEERIEGLRYKALLQEKRQAANRAVIAHYRQADHFYIDKHIESLTLLEPEVEALKLLQEEKNFIGSDIVQKRLEQLTTKANQIAFTEGIVQSYPLFQETTETLIHPVEANIEDLQKLLTTIEGVPISSFEPPPDRPQLLILDFKLDKKNSSESNEVLQLNLKLLKREYL